MKGRGWYFLTAALCSPLYFAIRGKWLACLLNSMLYGLALLTLIFGIGVLFWAAGVAHAIWDLGMLMQEDRLQRQAKLIARESAQGRVQKQGGGRA